MRDIREFSTYFSGIYITNIELFEFAKSISFDIPLLSTEELFGKIDGYCNSKNISKEFDGFLVSVIDDRIDIYNQLKSLSNHSIIDTWIAKADNLKSHIING